MSVPRRIAALLELATQDVDAARTHFCDAVLDRRGDELAAWITDANAR